MVLCCFKRPRVYIGRAFYSAYLPNDFVYLATVRYLHHLPSQIEPFGAEGGVGVALVT